MSTSDPRDALADLFKGIQSTFKRYDRAARRKAWEGLISTRGKEQVGKILNSPTYQIVGIPRILSFKDWYEQNP